MAQKIRDTVQDLREQRDAAESTASGLRRALEGMLCGVADRDIVDCKALARGDGQPRSYPITVTDTAIIYAATALAASPAEHERRIKSEALREAAAKVVEFGNAPLSLAYAHFLDAEADRLEAANGR